MDRQSSCCRRVACHSKQTYADHGSERTSCIQGQVHTSRSFELNSTLSLMTCARGFPAACLGQLSAHGLFERTDLLNFLLCDVSSVSACMRVPHAVALQG